MNLYDVTVPHLTKSLKNLERWIDKALDFAAAKRFPPDDLLTARLAPDQLPLLRQIMAVCDNAKFVVSRPVGKESPLHPDTQASWPDLRARVQDVRSYVASFERGDFDGTEDRMVKLPFMPGKALRARDYVLEFGLPNFNFHLVITYAILRHSGVDLGKVDFIGSLPLIDVSAPASAGDVSAPASPGDTSAP